MLGQAVPQREKQMEEPISTKIAQRGMGLPTVTYDQNQTMVPLEISV